MTMEFGTVVQTHGNSCNTAVPTMLRYTNNARPIAVFVAEDSAIIRDVLTQRLEDDARFAVVGYAETAQDTIAALEQQGQLDILLLDLQLKQGTGYDVLAYLRSARAPGELQTVVLTNYASPAYRQRAMTLGASGFFDKSMEFDNMLHALRVWADEKLGIAGKH